jgi:hypothetical protein
MLLGERAGCCSASTRTLRLQAIVAQTGTRFALGSQLPMKPPITNDFTELQREIVSGLLAALARDPDAMLRLHRLAERYGGFPRGSFQAREVVADVIADILEGAARCDPERALGRQVELHVKRRARRLREPDTPRTRRPRLIPLDQAPDELLAIDSMSHIDDEPDVDPVEWAARIRALAVDNLGAQQLLELYDREICSRRDVLATGMTEWTYRAARERLIDYATVARSELCRVEHDLDEDVDK